jgi:hypothetical protein
MPRYLLLLSLMFLAGCVSHIQRPEAIGVVVDAETGNPILAAKVTCPPVAQSWNVPQGFPEITVTTGRYGRFRFPAKRDSNFLLSFNTTPEMFISTFTIQADGYMATNITGHASSNTMWRFDFGRIRLGHQ